MKIAALRDLASRRSRSLARKDFHFVDVTTAEIGLNDHLDAVKKQ